MARWRKQVAAWTSSVGSKGCNTLPGRLGRRTLRLTALRSNQLSHRSFCSMFIYNAMRRAKCKQMDKARVSTSCRIKQNAGSNPARTAKLKGCHCAKFSKQLFYVHSMTAVLHGNLRLRNHGQASHWTISSKQPGYSSVEHLTVDFCGNQMVPAPVPGGQSLDSLIMCSPFFVLANRTSCSTCSDTLPCFWGKRCFLGQDF